VLDCIGQYPGRRRFANKTMPTKQAGFPQIFHF